RVLVIEDDTNTRAALARWLQYEYDVTTAEDGLDGIRQALEHTPDAIVADVWMPRMDGIAMVRRLKEHDALRRVPVILLSGQTSVEAVVAGLAAGVRAYLYKPVDLDLLDRKLRSALHDQVRAR
ncbi:MAG TPA: response regulator, partial [Polyangiaceae bacterium]|nr:response regulator [Polyangiaceae bacterium]